MKLQLCIRFIPKFSGDIGDFEMLPRATFEPVKNNFDGWQTILADQRFVNQHFHKPGLDGQSVRIDLGDFVAQGREQALRMRPALGISALARRRKPFPVIPPSCFGCSGCSSFFSTLLPLLAMHAVQVC
jgi:hypothetical protein